MITSINISNAELEKFTKHLFSEGNESKTYIFEINGEKKIVKIFKKTDNLPNKIKKINLLNERLKKCNFVVKPESILKNNGETIGYIMPKIDGEVFDYLNYSKEECVYILKDLSKKLKRLHKLGIVAADFHRNLMIDTNGNLHLIDCDNFAIDNLYVDLENIYLKKYNESIKYFDKRFDNYLLNIFTISCITRIFCPFLYSEYRAKPLEIYSQNEEINAIISNTFNLNKQYNEELIIDKIFSKKHSKKIKLKNF